MVEHGDLVTVHEPFDNIADHGSTEVDGHVVSDPAELITTLLDLAGTTAVFFKETTDRRHHAVLASPRFLAEARHTFLYPRAGRDRRLLLCASGPAADAGRDRA
jgi:hypothetical protein